MDAIAVDRPKLRDPGIYFDLDEDVYHADPALGSSDERRLALNPSDYWWGSWMNPRRRPDKETPSTIRGSAVHALVLYGEAVFDERYMRGAELTEDMTAAEKGALTKAANKKAEERGLVALPAETYDNIAIASAMIAKNPKLAKALVGGVNEVSIFWRDRANGIPKKARVDCMKVARRNQVSYLGLGDLKSLVNKYDKPFPKACTDAISNYRYDVQAKHYMNGCSLIPKLVADGCVHGSHDPDVLKLLASTTACAWQFVFWQAEGAPLTFSKVISPANPLLEVAQATLDRADHNYLDYMERFGTSMWLLEEEPTELLLEELPPWHARD
jgi:hypothetical protein